jgi:A/G-specific adenine glycosylase
MPHDPKSKIEIQKLKIERLVPVLLAWFSRNARDLPWRRTRDPYAIWVSEIMLQQTQVKTVVPYWECWMQELPTIQSLAKARPEKIHKLWEGLGYYTRVRNLQRSAQLICEKHGGRFPDHFDDALALPGIGRYTAGAICSIAFNQPAPILDGNVIRVLTRIFGITGNPREKKANARLWQLAEELVLQASRPAPRTPRLAPRASHLNQSLMELGALVCTPRRPQCVVCPAKKFCVASQEDRIEQLPNLGARPATTHRRFHAYIVERRGRFLVRQRPAGVVNAHLWEFPNEEISTRFTSMRGNSRPFCTVKHSITRYRITLDAFVADAGVKKYVDGDGRWLTLPELKKLSFPGAHKKILASLAGAR